MDGLRMGKMDQKNQENLMALMDVRHAPSINASVREQRLSFSQIEESLGDWQKDQSWSDELKALMKSLVLLWHDYLDECHSICQDYGHPEASYIHGMMHRREGDAGNARYWFRRALPLEDMPDLAQDMAHQFQSISGNAPTFHFLTSDDWDPIGFVNACQEGKDLPALVRIQASEFHALANHLIRQL
jgi:hypothetical protein